MTAPRKARKVLPPQGAFRVQPEGSSRLDGFRGEARTRRDRHYPGDSRTERMALGVLEGDICPHCEAPKRHHWDPEGECDLLWSAPRVKVEAKRPPATTVGRRMELGDLQALAMLREFLPAE